MFYLTRFKCPKKNKIYIIPTKDWLKPLEFLITTDITTKGTLFISELLNEEKILVKITKGKNYDLKNLNKLLKNEPNIVYTYCTFFCSENIDKIIEKQEFCDGKEPSTLELMFYYKRGSLSKFRNKLEKGQIKDIITQLIYCQLNIFIGYGLTHNDIHLGNILVQKYKTPKILKYKFLNKEISNNYEYILSDYDLMISFNPMNIKKYHGIFGKDNYFEFSLLSNIITTINIIEKLSISKMNFVTIQNKYEVKLINLTKNNLKLYLKNKISYQDFIKNEVNNIIPFIEEIFTICE
jgi:hypothetical protein